MDLEADAYATRGCVWHPRVRGWPSKQQSIPAIKVSRYTDWVDLEVGAAHGGDGTAF